MSFQCYAHADNTREYIMTSDAQRINSYDFLLVLFSLCLVYILVRCPCFFLSFWLHNQGNWRVTTRQTYSIERYCNHKRPSIGNDIYSVYSDRTVSPAPDSLQVLHGHGRYFFISAGLLDPIIIQILFTKQLAVLTIIL